LIAVDTNVLVYAHRQELPHHTQSLKWLKYLAEGDVPWALPVFCLGEFIRVVTHPRVFHPPSTLDQAFSALQGLLKSRSVRVLNPGSRYPSLFDETTRSADARGNLAFDAQIAAVCLENGVHSFLTLDRDFSRFSAMRLLSVADTPGR
jgi:uncharacterized protein